MRKSWLYSHLNSCRYLGSPSSSQMMKRRSCSPDLPSISALKCKNAIDVVQTRCNPWLLARLRKHIPRKQSRTIIINKHCVTSSCKVIAHVLRSTSRRVKPSQARQNRHVWAKYPNRSQQSQKQSALLHADASVKIGAAPEKATHDTMQFPFHRHESVPEQSTSGSP